MSFLKGGGGPLRPKGPKSRLKAESGAGVFGEGQRAPCPSPLARESGGAL